VDRGNHRHRTVPARLLAGLRALPPVTPGSTDAQWLGEHNLRPLAGGRNNRVYAWSSPDGPVCIKLYKVDERRRAHREWHALTLLAEHAVEGAPFPLWIDPEPAQPAIGMTFLPGTSIPDIADKGNALRGMAQTLKP